MKIHGIWEIADPTKDTAPDKNIPKNVVSARVSKEIINLRL